MREQRANEQREAQKRTAPESAKAAPESAKAAPEPPKSTPEPAKPAPAPEAAKPTSPHGQLAQAFGAGDMDGYDDDDASLGGVSDDRTAVFRPPPELLARAKRMKPPSKPNPTSELPTKPPPASATGDWVEASRGVPAASRLPAFESVPVKASLSSNAPAASNYASTPALDAAAAPQLSGLAESQPISSQEIERSAVFAHSEATSGVLSLGLPEAPSDEETAGDEPLPGAEAGEAEVVPIANDALLNALTASAQGPVTDASDEESPAPTTTSPLVRSERSVAPEAARAGAPRVSLWLAVVLAAAAFVFWRLRHGL
jgi:hypothetical protein